MATCRAPYVTAFVFSAVTAPAETSTLSLHDALPISATDAQLPRRAAEQDASNPAFGMLVAGRIATDSQDRKSTRLNSSHANISYAVFCLKKKSTIGTHGSRAVGAHPCRFRGQLAVQT